MAHYEIIFEGRTEPGFDLATVQSNLQSLFKASPEQVARMFSGRPVILRNRLDEVTARKYEAALRKSGASILVRRMEAEEGVATATPPPDASASAASAPATSASKSVSAATRAPASQSGLNLAGERADDILQHIDWDVAPVGADLGEMPRAAAGLEMGFESDWGLAPVGSDLGQIKSDKTAPEVDISHLSLLPPSR